MQRPCVTQLYNPLQLYRPYRPHQCYSIHLPTFSNISTHNTILVYPKIQKKKKKNKLDTQEPWVGLEQGLGWHELFMHSFTQSHSTTGTHRHTKQAYTDTRTNHSTHSSTFTLLTVKHTSCVPHKFIHTQSSHPCTALALLSQGESTRYKSHSDSAHI